MISAEELSAQLKGRGIFEWISPIIQHLQIGDSDGDCAMLHKILNEEGQENFMRLNIKVSRDHKSLDDASAQNVAYLYQRGIAATESQVYKTMIERLKHN